jgi:putative hydrolase of the HAD superfamily
MTLQARLVLIDLDNTLLDRTAIFRAWALGFLDRNELGETELAWLLAHDDDGFLPREPFFATLRDRYRIEASTSTLVAEYRSAYLELVAPPATSTFAALGTLRAHGYSLAIVTNGSPNQERVIDRAALRPYVDAVCVSATLGVRKPDPAIFAHAAELCRAHLADAWMVGDSPEHDIFGASRAGLRSVWITRGRRWEQREYTPTLVAASFRNAVTLILDVDGLDAPSPARY